MFCTTCFGHPKECDCGFLQPKPSCIPVVEVRPQRDHSPDAVASVGAMVGSAGPRLDGEEVSWGRVKCSACDGTFRHLIGCPKAARAALSQGGGA